MQSRTHSLKLQGKTVLLTVALLPLLLLVFAVLIQSGTLPAESMEVLVITAVVAVAFVGAFLTVRRSGEPMQGFVYAGLLFLLLFVASFFVCGLEGLNGQMLKRMISIFAGTIIGNLLGQRQYYRLRNHGKRRRKTTK